MSKPGFLKTAEEKVAERQGDPVLRQMPPVGCGKRYFRVIDGEVCETLSPAVDSSAFRRETVPFAIWGTAET